MGVARKGWEKARCRGDRAGRVTKGTGDVQNRGFRPQGAYRNWGAVLGVVNIKYLFTKTGFRYTPGLEHFYCKKWDGEAKKAYRNRLGAKKAAKRGVVGQKHPFFTAKIGQKRCTGIAPETVPESSVSRFSAEKGLFYAEKGSCERMHQQRVAGGGGGGAVP